MTSLAKVLIITGGLLIILGIIFLILPKLTFFGRLPGDIYIKKEKFTFYFPVVTCILTSAVITLIFWLFRPK